MLYFDRRVYAGAVVLVVVALRQQRVTGYGARRLMELFGVSPRTLRRWMAWFAAVFPGSARWRSCRGRVGATVRDDVVPGALVMTVFDEVDHVARLAFLLRFLLGPDPPIRPR